MNRRTFLLGALALGGLSSLVSRLQAAENLPSDVIKKIVKSDAEWKALLPLDRYKILRKEATEPRFSSPLNHEKRAGTFACAGCDLGLFSSKTKYDSGTGWPSFYRALPGRVGTKVDTFLWRPRTEYHCIRCGGHQGHIFDDGPPPTGKRYCNNGLALRFHAGVAP
ncbi:MAG: peptide-methionine (R)-S-oxide reductase MsrB [Magnetococcales bacterium]|nr:peptide-methionine (R)-S-oxide reductase MsrB [Magnetococcales bacterium]